MYAANTWISHDQSSSAQHWVKGETAQILTAIYTRAINLVQFERSMDKAVSHYCQTLLTAAPRLNLRLALSAEHPARALCKVLPAHAERDAFAADLGQLIEMYTCLFELDEVGLRLQVIDRAMCPRFHVDRLGCRLVSTYRGAATQWLDNDDVDRSKLGRGSLRVGDEHSGIYQSDCHIVQAREGDVLLLKGEGWPGNQGLGAVRRSPPMVSGERRLIATLDFA
ncbi:MAG: DUF1826 domain-containing protein [Pseudomonadales bacterium]